MIIVLYFDTVLLIDHSDNSMHVCAQMLIFQISPKGQESKQIQFIETHRILLTSLPSLPFSPWGPRGPSGPAAPGGPWNPLSGWHTEGQGERRYHGGEHQNTAARRR